jgi:hypothetical protein
MPSRFLSPELVVQDAPFGHRSFCRVGKFYLPSQKGNYQSLPDSDGSFGAGLPNRGRDLMSLPTVNRANAQPLPHSELERRLHVWPRAAFRASRVVFGASEELVGS